jgi:hypothetical protein
MVSDDHHSGVLGRFRFFHQVLHVSSSAVRKKLVPIIEIPTGGGSTAEFEVQPFEFFLGHLFHMA